MAGGSSIERSSHQRARLGQYSADECVDIHCHILPGIDDGPATLDESLALCRALAARNGCEALTILETTRPSLVLLDLMMPELDGFHVLDYVRASETTRDRQSPSTSCHPDPLSDT